MITPTKIALMKEMARAMAMRDLPYSVLKDYTPRLGYDDPFGLPEDKLQDFVLLHNQPPWAS